MGYVNQQNCFMLKDKGKQHGPYDMKQLAEMAKAANFTGNTLVWRPGMNSWTKAAKVSELELLLNNPYVFDTMGNQQTQSVQQTPPPQPMIPPQQLSPVLQNPMPKKNNPTSVPPPFHGGTSVPPPPPFRPSKQYYVMMNNQQFGPYDTEQMKQFAKDGRLTRDTFVWSEGMTEWMKSEKVDVFSSFFKPLTVPPPLPTSPIAPPPPNVSATTSTHSKSGKYGDIRKCPSCGSFVEPFSTRCKECGYEFTNVVSVSSTTQLFQKLEELENQKDNKFFGNDFKIYEKKLLAIKTFPIPNSKEDILEFITMAAPLSYLKPDKWTILGKEDPNSQVTYAWRAKCEQAIMKARFAMKDDKEMLAIIEQSAKNLNIK